MIADLEQIPPHFEGEAIALAKAFLLVDHNLDLLEVVDNVYEYEALAGYAFGTNSSSECGS